MNQEQAQGLIDKARTAAEELGTPMTIAIVDTGGYLVAFERMDGCSFLSCEVATSKAWTAAAVGLPTALFAELAAGDPGFLISGSVVHNGRLMAVPGGAPAKAGDAVIGAIGISGGTADQDQQIADAAVA
jgi:glc operon protein GlcG